MDWFQPIDNYCERVGAGFWAEPLNAISNLAFLMAAAAVFALLRKQSGRDLPTLVPEHIPPKRRRFDDKDMLQHIDSGAISYHENEPVFVESALAAIVAIIGIGSFLFHTFANRWSALADVLPIAVFIHLYLFVALRRYFGAGIVLSLLIVGGFAAISPRVARILGPLIGSTASYAPALLAMLATGLLLVRKNSVASTRLLTAALIFGLSMNFRAFDAPLCDAFPQGTHFIWHLLNALTLFLLMRTLIHARVGAAVSTP